MCCAVRKHSSVLVDTTPSQIEALVLRFQELPTADNLSELISAHRAYVQCDATHMSKHMIPKRSKEYMDFQKNAHKFQKICYSGIIPFVYVGKNEILKYI